MQRKVPAKRATRANPREDRNQPNHAEDRQRFNIIPIKKVNIFPKSLAQENYLDALDDSGKTIVIATGPAGTGKTFLSTMFAIKSLIEGRFKKIVITRPTVSTGEDIGFLPGSLYDKLAPWSVPILDIFKEIYPAAAVERMIKDEVLEVAALGMMRGRTLANSIVMLDESQNATPSQVLMMATRIGNNSKLIINGDLKQHDRGFEHSGLKDIVERFKRYQARGHVSQRIVVCEFGLGDIERNPVVEEVLRMYEN